MMEEAGTDEMVGEKELLRPGLVEIGQGPAGHWNA
jgi:hypothetical protein